jgi:hypothetical protein
LTAVSGRNSAPVRLRTGVWRDEHMTRAWRTRDFRAVFQLACRNGLTPPIIADNTGLPLDLVLSVMKGNTTLNNPGLIESVARGLDMPEETRAVLGLAIRAVGRADLPGPQQRETTTIAKRPNRSVTGRSGRKRQRAPDYLPDEVIEREDFAEACASHDLGAMFRIAVDYGGACFTVSHIARRCEMTVSQVSAYMNHGREAVSINIFKRVSVGLRIPGAMLGLDNNALMIQESDAASQYATELPNFDFPLSSETIAADNGRSPSDPEVATFLLETLPQYARTANILGGKNLPELIERHIRFIYSGCETSRGKYRDRILDTCARYAEFLGWLHQDLGNPVYALFWTDRASEWAQETNADPQFLSYVLMRKSDHAEQYGTPDRVIGLAQSALKVPALSPRAKALVIQQEARGYSQRGDLILFERKLDEARECALKAEGSNDALWGEYCNLTHIAMQEAGGRIELRQFDKAIEIIERELPRMSPVDRVDSTVFRAKLARAYAESGNADCAAETALATCEDIRATASKRAFTELSRVRQILENHIELPASASFAVTFDSLASEFTTRTRQIR